MPPTTMTSATKVAILSACTALVAAGCAPKRVLPDSSNIPTDEEKRSDDDWGQEQRMFDEEWYDRGPPPQPPSLEEQIRIGKRMIKRNGDFPEIIASDDHDTLLSIEALFSAMRGLVNDPKLWFQQLGFSARDQVLFLGTGNESFLCCRESAPAPDPDGVSARPSGTLPSKTQLALTANVPPTPSVASAGSTIELCSELCAKTATLHCKSAGECLERCREMGSLAACKSEMTDAFRCFARQPVQNWHCDDEDIASIKDGFCDSEQEKFLACVQRQ